MIEFIIPNLEGFFLKGGRQSICRLNAQNLKASKIAFLYNRSYQTLQRFSN
jgi:hypothetical protein